MRRLTDEAADRAVLDRELRQTLTRSHMNARSLGAPALPMRTGLARDAEEGGRTRNGCAARLASDGGRDGPGTAATR
jgi:hypothetical protein